MLKSYTSEIRGDVISYLIAIIIVFASWTVYYRIPFMWGFYIIITFWIFAHYKHNAKKEKLFWAFLFLSLWFYRPADFSISGGGIVKSLFISSLFLLEDDSQNRVIYCIRKVLTLVILIGVVLHVYGIFTGLAIPKITTIYGDNETYHVYPLLVYQEGLESLRFASIFNEPGYLGTILGLLLLLDGFDLRDKKNLVLFIGGMLTLSVAFYVFALLGLLAYSIKKKSLKSLLIYAVLVTLSLIAIIHFFPDLWDFIVNRQEFSSLNEGEIESSRGGKDIFQVGVNAISKRPFINVLLGNGYDSPQLITNSTDQFVIAGSIIFRLIYQIGYIGLMYLIFFVWFNKKKGFIPLLFSIAFILSLYQRPHIFEPMYIIMLASIMSSSVNYKTKIKNSYNR